MEKSFKIAITEIQEQSKFIFRSNYGWKNCLNASSERTARHYSLVHSYLNYIKLRKVASFAGFNVNLNSLILGNLSTELRELRTYQKADVEFLKNLKSVAFFNEMRTGKTPTSLLLTAAWGVGKVLIIVPGILQKQWQNAVEEWLQEPAYIISELSKEERLIFYQKFCTEKKLILIISKDTFKTDSSYFGDLRKKHRKEIGTFCALVDEAHYLRNYSSQQSISIYSLSDSDYKILLTGTPVVNNYADIFGTLKFIKPSKYSSYWKFVNTFFKIDHSDFINKGGKRIFLKSVSGFKSPVHEQQLKDEIHSFSVNRRQKDVLPWLPLIIRQKEILTMSKSHQEVYTNFLEASNGYSAELVLNLKSILLYPRHIIPDFKEDGVKIDYLVEFCQENQDKQILIFSTRTDTFLDHLAEVMKSKKLQFGVITGKITQDQRQFYITKFQSSAIKIMLCNIMSAGFGLNLDNADTAIFADRSYSPADNDQAEARFLPTVEFEGVKVRLIIDLVCKDTIDERILKLLDKKKDVMKIINSTPAALFEDSEL